MDNKALGKGLSALIAQTQDQTKPSEAQVAQQPAQGHLPGILPTELIDNNPCQPRVNYNQEALAELQASIKEKGILQPLLVRPKGVRFQVVAGQRRLTAARALGLKEIPVLVRSVSDEECLLLAIVENVQREELNPIEEANALNTLIEGFKMTQEQVAQSVGKDRSTISNMLRLLNLPGPIQEYLIDGKLTMGHARALLALDNEADQMDLAKKIVEQDLSVRSVEGLAKQGTAKKPKKTKAQKAKDPEIANLEDELRKILGTKVLVEDKKGKGKLVIEYYSLDDLDRVLNILRKK